MAPSQVPEPKQYYTALFLRCKVCAGHEEVNKRFLICGHSACFYKYYHISCLTTEQIASDVQMGSQCWLCPSCLCRVCLCDTDDDKIILCDRCDQGYHLYCLSPPKRKVPKESWECDPCKEQKEKENRILMLHRKDYDNDILMLDGPDLLPKAAKDLEDDDGPDLLLKAAKDLEDDEEVNVGTTTRK